MRQLRLWFGLLLLVTILGSSTLSGVAAAPTPSGRITYQGANNTLRVVGADGQGERTIATRGGIATPRWSPDGKFLVYSDELPSDPYRGQLVITDLATGTNRVLVAPESRDPELELYWSYLQPRWSPDGTSIVYIRSAGSRITAIMRVSVTGGTPELLFNGTSSTRFDLSPTTGKFVLSDDAFAEEPVQGSRLVLISPDGYLERVLLPRTGVYYFQPTWLPDGSGIVVRKQAARNSTTATLELINPADGTAKTITTVPAGSSFSFSPDLAWIAIAAGDSKQIQLFARDTLTPGPVIGLGTAPHWEPQAQTRTFPETGFTVGGRFLAYWNANGGLPIYGYPLTNEISERLEDGNTYTVQYFERARFEYHPEMSDPRYQVLLGQFGRRIHPADPPVAPLAGATHYPETGHNLGGRFADYWQAHGGLPQFGYPISEEFTETLEDGKPYLVQYFERARFEYHPENTDPQYQVLLGQFGRRILSQR